MAQIGTCILLSLLLFTGASARAAEALPPELVDQEAAEAFKQYWQAFEAYEAKIVNEGQRRFRESWDEVKRIYQREHGKISDAQLEALQKAAAKYRQHLERLSDADNRAYVMLNLAQVLVLIGDHLSRDDASAGTFAKNEALGLLRDIEERYPAFSYREQAGYLRGVALESLDRQDDALTAWRSLAATARGTIYGVHAHVAVGDHMWQRDRAADAMQAYQRALELLPSVEAEDPEYERVRINYRLAWAASRAAEVAVVVRATTALLEPGRRIKSVEQREKIQQDAIELLGDALYENNVMTRTQDILKRKELTAFGAAVGLRTVLRYNASGIHSEAAALGEFVAETFPLAAATPQVLQVTADSWDKLGQAPKRLAALERLGLLLPAQSLWRSRHHDDPNAIKAMEAIASSAALAAATIHYDTGLASGNVKAFSTAGSFYEILLEYEPNGEVSNSWRLRQAHCRYFMGDYDEAARLYRALKTEYKVDPETLQVAAYQLVLTHERRWREHFAKASEKGDNPLQDTATLAALKALAQSIDEFVARFPGPSRAVDLLLVGASAHRDMERLDEAAKYWQRTLVSQPSPAQRGIAIRGLVFANMKNGSPGDVVELVRRFLKLEDLQALGLNLGNELRGVLSAAALDEGYRLNESGQVMEAGLLMTQIASEFPQLPDRDRIFRDGAYMLAIGGDWAAAQRAAEDYFLAGLSQHRADMTYLLARAHEYQIRLKDAALQYTELGETHPTHPRAITSLDRGEKLALAEGDYALAARAAAAQAESARSEADRLKHYTRAVEHLEKANEPRQALALARRRLSTSRTLGERLRSRVLVARMTYLTGSEQAALNELSAVARDVERSRPNLGREEYATINGEVHFLLGEEARRRFEDFRIVERSGGVAANLAQKTRYFEDLAANYDKAAAAGDPTWAARARFQLAQSAEAFADEIASIPNRTDEALSLRSQNRYKQTVGRLQAMARRYYSSNVLAARRDPSKFRDNEWVQKSALRVSGETPRSADEERQQDLVPAAIQDNVPLQWSL